MVVQRANNIWNIPHSHISRQCLALYEELSPPKWWGFLWPRSESRDWPVPFGD